MTSIEKSIHSIKAIETEYKGYRFRSRLEARWAVFFDACGVRWEYEPEGFDLGDGLYYLPDFLLHDVLFRDSDKLHDLWVEVKGQMTVHDAEKIIKFANCRDVGNVDNPTLVVTNIPNGEDFYELIDYMSDLAYEGKESCYPFNFDLIDGDCFGAFPCVNTKGRFVIMDANGRCIDGEDPDATEAAYAKARQARFEHRQRRC